MSMGMLNEARAGLAGATGDLDEIEASRKAALAKQRKVGLWWMASALAAMVFIVLSRGGPQYVDFGPLEQFKPKSWKFIGESQWERMKRNGIKFEKPKEAVEDQVVETEVEETIKQAIDESNLPNNLESEKEL